MEGPQKHMSLCKMQVAEGENVSGQLRRISPTVEEIEAEFWRIVETPEEVRILIMLHCLVSY